MEQDNNDFTNENDTSSKQEKEKIEAWRNEHGQPNFKFLESLAEKGDALSLERLKFIADDWDVTYDNSTSSKKLVEKIILATQIDPNISD